MNFAMGQLLEDEPVRAVDRLRPVAEQAQANAKSSGIGLSPDTVAAIDEALGDTPIRGPTLAPLAQAGMNHR